MTTGDNEVDKDRPVPRPPMVTDSASTSEFRAAPGPPSEPVVFSPHFFRRDRDNASRVRIRFSPKEVALIEDAAEDTPVLLFLHRVIGHACREALRKRAEAQRAADIEAKTATVTTLRQALAGLEPGQGIAVLQFPPFWHVVARLNSDLDIEYIVADSKLGSPVPRQVFGPTAVRAEAAHWARAARRAWFSDPVIPAANETFLYDTEQQSGQ